MSAIISPCGRYRYRLDRGPFELLPLLELGDDGVYELRGKVIGFFGVNPSTADASVDDQTIMKWIGFCQRWGAHRFIVANISPLRTTDVIGLARIQVPPEVQQQNRLHLQSIIAEADVLIPCWGDRNKTPRHIHKDFDVVHEMLMAGGKPVMHLGLTKGGDPKHPLMLPYTTPLIRWHSAPKR